jgi:hypothetical protein
MRELGEDKKILRAVTQRSFKQGVSRTRCRNGNQYNAVTFCPRTGEGEYSA